MEELLTELEMDDLNGRIRDLAEVIGMEAFCKLIKYFGGTEPYIPNLKDILLPVRNRMIVREFDGINYFELSRKWGLTERYIRDIVNDRAKEIKREPIEGQTTWFEILN